MRAGCWRYPLGVTQGLLESDNGINSNHIAIFCRGAFHLSGVRYVSKRTYWWKCRFLRADAKHYYSGLFLRLPYFSVCGVVFARSTQLVASGLHHNGATSWLCFHSYPFLLLPLPHSASLFKRFSLHSVFVTHKSSALARLIYILSWRWNKRVSRFNLERHSCCKVLWQVR